MYTLRRLSAETPKRAVQSFPLLHDSTLLDDPEHYALLNAREVSVLNKIVWRGG